MNKFEKEYYIDRLNTGSAKWDGLKGMFGETGLLPMWVADMDFRSPECVTDALKAYILSGDYGYRMPPTTHLDAVIHWEKNRHGYDVYHKWIRFTPGVVSGIYRMLSAFTNPGDSCIILSPCYYPFMTAVEDCGRKLVCSLMFESQGKYEINFDDFETKITQERVRAFILCSPHNPVGRVWTAYELKTLLDICAKHNVIVISDEIHQDLVFGKTHIPTATASESNHLVVTLSAASKTFNLAGFSHSFAIIPDQELRQKYDEYNKTVHVGGSSLGHIATTAAYQGGEQWLEGLLGTLKENAEYIKEQFGLHLPEAIVSPLEGTYLMWIDLGGYVKPDSIKEAVQGKGRLAVDYGSWFYCKGMEKDDCHIRINIATKKENIVEAVNRLIAALNENKV